MQRPWAHLAARVGWVVNQLLPGIHDALALGKGAAGGCLQLRGLAVLQLKGDGHQGHLVASLVAAQAAGRAAGVRKRGEPVPAVPAHQHDAGCTGELMPRHACTSTLSKAAAQTAPRVSTRFSLLQEEQHPARVLGPVLLALRLGPEVVQHLLQRRAQRRRGSSKSAVRTGS